MCLDKRLDYLHTQHVNCVCYWKMSWIKNFVNATVLGNCWLIAFVRCLILEELSNKPGHFSSMVFQQFFFQSGSKEMSVPSWLWRYRWQGLKGTSKSEEGSNGSAHSALRGRRETGNSFTFGSWPTHDSVCRLWGGKRVLREKIVWKDWISVCRIKGHPPRHKK